MSILFQKTRNVKSPKRGTPLSAGIDFFVPDDFKATTLESGDEVKIPSGIKVKLPENTAFVAFNKSGVSLKGLEVGACVVDEDYQGEIHLHVYNRSKHPVNVSPGDKLVQFVLIKQDYCDVVIVNEGKLHDQKTDRGEGGFGSTGNA